jgi:hypothetical protein
MCGEQGRLLGAERKPLGTLMKSPASSRAAAAMRSKASATSGRIGLPCR